MKKNGYIISGLKIKACPRQPENAMDKCILPNGCLTDKCVKILHFSCCFDFFS